MARGRKPKKRYFDLDTQDAIIRYNNSNNISEKNLIYTNEIHKPFMKLAENLIHTFKFYYTDVDNIQDLQYEVVIFLLSKINKYNHETGFKAFSYFQTIGKRWLITYNSNNYKKILKSSNIASLNDNEYNSDDYEYSEHLPNQLVYIDSIHNDHLDSEDKTKFIKDFIDYVESNINNIFLDDLDIKICQSILDIYKSKDSLSNLNKRVLYIYIKELLPEYTIKSQKITSILGILRKKYYNRFSEYIDKLN